MLGAKAEIHKLLDELACAGLALVVISSELPEVMTLNRRALVMRGGTVAGVLPRAEATVPPAIVVWPWDCGWRSPPSPRRPW
jgi:ABC-type sugar transport system ATPase subunit